LKELKRQEKASKLSQARQEIKILLIVSSFDQSKCDAIGLSCLHECDMISTIVYSTLYKKIVSWLWVVAASPFFFVWIILNH
jgi:hypothetical protein